MTPEFSGMGTGQGSGDKIVCDLCAGLTLP